MYDSEDHIEDQRRRFDEEASDYERHHRDPISQKYRDQFFRDRLFDFDLRGKTVLDAMCASGIDAGYFLARGARVTGLDISPENAALYRRRWGEACVVCSVHNTGLPNDAFDVVYICGGLHHVIPLLSETVREVHRVLKPGGLFCFLEPNADTWVDRLRRIWYRRDPRFQSSEQAISYGRQLRPQLTVGFQEDTLFFGGNIAYMLILQSMILGTQASIKKLIHRPLFVLEKHVGALPFVPKLFFCARWRKA